MRIFSGIFLVLIQLNIECRILTLDMVNVDDVLKHLLTYHDLPIFQALQTMQWHA